jgi:transposase
MVDRTADAAAEIGRHNATEADKDNVFKLFTSWKSDKAKSKPTFNRIIVLWRASSWRTPEGKGGMKTIPFKPAQPVSAAVASVISWPMKRLAIEVPIDVHIRLTGVPCAVKRSPTWSGP